MERCKLLSERSELLMNPATDIWNKVLNLLRRDLTEVAITTWFEECTAVDLSDNRLFIHAPSEHVKKVIDERFLGSIKNALGELFSSGDFDVVVLDDEGLKAMKEAPEVPDYLGLDKFTFEKFVVGSSNKFAHAMALSVSEGNTGYNPLFIYGDPGLGKTHLLYAIQHAIENKFPHYNVVCIKGENFTNELIAAIGKNKTAEFREKYRGTDYFLIDDIQFIAGKGGSEEEYFNTFNTLFELDKQLVLTSDRPPKDLYLLADRLRSRFESGVMADIKPPDEALRIAIINNKAEQLGVILPEDVKNYIAENLGSSVRQLEGAVKMIIAYRDIIDDDLTVDIAKNFLKERFVGGGGDFIPSAELIIEETAKYYMQTPEDMKGLGRMADTVTARHIAMFLMRKLTNLTLKDVGSIFGRDYTTVLVSVRKIDKNIKEDDTTSNIIREITSNINNRTSNK